MLWTCYEIYEEISNPTYLAWEIIHQQTVYDSNKGSYTVVLLECCELEGDLQDNCSPLGATKTIPMI